ncbi:hypothetical protein [Microbulbifer aggregans]|uniref:hypothetical protein n=1 Tax=Microbulbifer aggregans TaxID=1769779 RepID=UPI001CFE4AD1|nr:hypothetical protein [Microbulbifer aggregans]
MSRLFFKYARMLMLFKALFLVSILSRAEDINTNLEHLKSTGIDGWRYQGKCEGGSERYKFKLDYYTPPPRKDVGGYGIFSVQVNGEKFYYSGFDLYPSNRSEDCGIIADKNTIIIDSEDWSRAKKYIVTFDIPGNEKRIFQYNLKKTLAFKKNISTDVYLIAGFGVCESDSIENWRFDLFCKDVDAKSVSSASESLEAHFGYDFLPYIPGVGIGAFNYFVVCNQCSEVDSELVRRYLKDYLSGVISKIETLDPKSRDFHSSLLALDSVPFSSPSLDGEFSSEVFNDNSERRKVIGDKFKSYWSIIYVTD